ncbi:MAG TPA: Crp/Fnr family transcriptional regulator [Dissulfurispiraceae bacterium]|nr:Crp/Fnr family transcriptional regulator [Dissulfurispiraceae bacterium]
MALTDIMAHIPLFSGMPKEHIEELTDIVVDQTFGKGQSIFSEGDEASGFYVVITGRVKVFKLSPEGKEQILHIFGAGEPFGEVPVFGGGRFPANAETIEKSRIFFFSRPAFVDLIRRQPSLALNMLAALSRLLRQLTHLVENLSLKEVPGRLAAYLLHLSQIREGSDDLELDVAKGQLASMLGTIPETLSRILAKMTNQGIIEMQGRRIRLTDRQALEDLASGMKSFL